jgi:DNA-binding CsgD family transcriptional regulator
MEAAFQFELTKTRFVPWPQIHSEPLPRRTTGVADQLTPQEFQIALQVAEGKTNREVGAALFLSPKTVEFHLTRTYRKLGIRSRAELVRRFTEAESDPPAGRPVVAGAADV